MAVVSWTPVPPPIGTSANGCLFYTASFASGDSSTPMAAPGMEATVQMTAVSGATLTAEGSIETASPTVWGTLKDVSGTAVSVTTIGGPLTLQPNFYFLRVLSTGGTSTVNLMLRYPRRR